MNRHTNVPPGPATPEASTATPTAHSLHVVLLTLAPGLAQDVVVLREEVNYFSQSNLTRGTSYPRVSAQPRSTLLRGEPGIRKPLDYHERRAWQDAARARGEIPVCGREVCLNLAHPAYVNQHTPLLYCAVCAGLINKFNPGFCSREAPAWEPPSTTAPAATAATAATFEDPPSSVRPSPPKLNRAQARAADLEAFKAQRKSSRAPTPQAPTAHPPTRRGPR